MARKRSPHPGIVVRPGRPAKGERPHIRYVDPETGRTRTEALPEGLSGKPLARWLQRRAAELMLTRARSSPPPGQTLSIDDAIAKYFREIHRLRESTRTQYRYSTDTFREWAASRTLRNTGDLTLAALRRFRAHLDHPGRAAASVNRDLTHVAACLEHLRKAGDIPRLSRDDISSGLARLPKDFEKKAPLSVAEIRRLIHVLGLEGATCEAPGAAEAGVEPPSVATRYRAFVLTLLLTGMRKEECRRLDPEAVDLTGAGRITLAADKTKTHKRRVIDLSVSPSVCALLKDFAGWNLTAHQVREMRQKLHPGITFQCLRVTCGTYLTCAPGIYGGASAYMSARRLGHSVTVAESNYVGEVVISPDAKTLEAAMGID